MAKAKHTYAVRLAVEGGNRVKADLVSVGTSGERSIKKIDGAMVAFSKRVGEARSGTGTLITLLQKMDPALLANVQAARTVDEAFEIIIRRASDLGNTLDRNALLAAAFGRTVGPLMANLIRDGVESLDRLRQRAHDLGIVLDEELIRNAERAKDEMDTLGQVLSANVTRAVLGLAPALADLSTWLANVAVDAGDAYERLKLIAQGDFNFEDLSLGATRREVEERKQELIEIARELKALPEENDDPSFWEWLWGTERENLTEELQEKVAIYRQWAANDRRLPDADGNDHARPWRRRHRPRCPARARGVRRRVRRRVPLSPRRHRRRRGADPGPERRRGVHARADAKLGAGPGRQARGQCRGQRPQHRARHPGFRRCAARAGRRSHPRHHD